MSEEPAAADVTGTSGFAAGLAASEARGDPALREDLADYLKDQRTLIANQNRVLHLQAEEMQERNPYERSYLRLRRFSGWAKAAVEFSIGLIALALVGGFGAMVWNAAHADGLIVESFTVPPDLAEKGLSGQAIASRMLDKITGIQRDTSSVLPSRAYANSWGDDLKVEIPQTGVSVGEVYRFLRGWLGHETRVSGEIVRTDTGVAVTARIGGANGATFAGPEAALDSLLLQSAQHVYRTTQPDRYARYLFYNADLGGLARYDEARGILTNMIANGTLAERASAAHGLGVLDASQGRMQAAIMDYRQALTWNPDLTVTYSNLAGAENILGHSEASLTVAQDCLRITDRRSVPNIIPGEAPRLRFGCQNRVAALLGNFAAVPGLVQSWLDTNGRGVSPEVPWSFAAIALAQQHDGAAAIAYIGKLPAPATAALARGRAITRLQLAAAREDWPAIIAQAAALGESSVKIDNYAANAAATQVVMVVRPWAAYALAMTGDLAAAYALMDRTPGDCDLCLRTRGRIRAAEGKSAAADYWFAKAVTAAPSIPFAYEDWGRSLLARGKADDAIAHFTIAGKISPHFADPLEGWGEALMAKNQSHLALAKFSEAEKYAPKWGRLHMKWGEALTYAGQPEKAKAQYALAAGLDLSSAEKAELAKVSHG